MRELLCGLPNHFLLSRSSFSRGKKMAAILTHLLADRHIP
jgi:hypothetical protein